MIDALPNVRVVDFDPDFAAVVRAADAVVCMGGYNSIAESVYFGKRPIVMPRVPGSEEQVLRAEGFARLGLATVVGPDPLDASALWDAIDRELSRAGLSRADGCLRRSGLYRTGAGRSRGQLIPGFGPRPNCRIIASLAKRTMASR